MKQLQYGAMALLADAVLFYTIVHVTDRSEQMVIMVLLALLAQCSFGLWLASGFQRALQLQREMVVGLQAESEKRKATLRGMQETLAESQKADQQQ